MNKQRIQDAHDAAVAQMDGKSFELHQTDCAVCQDFGRPLPDARSVRSATQETTEGK